MISSWKDNVMLLEVIVLVLHSVVEALLDFHQRNFNFGKVLTAFSQSSSGTNFKICLAQCSIKVVSGGGRISIIISRLASLPSEREINCSGSWTNKIHFAV